MALPDDKKLSDPTSPELSPTMSPPHSLQKGDILGQESLDPVLNRKMHLVNNAIDEIGMTGYQWKLFVLNGFGYAVDSLMLLIQSIIATYAAYEFNPSFKYGLTIAVEEICF
ncbi:Major Facilitator superfamily [Elasticomyces elasticus]|nr:Major Facilitator superfamily [Elasticomyces elasticus]